MGRLSLRPRRIACNVVAGHEQAPTSTGMTASTSFKITYDFFILNLRTIYGRSIQMSYGQQKWLAERDKVMSIEEVSAERFAQLFHHYHRVLSHGSGSAARLRTCDEWANVPPSEKNRLIAACRLALLEVEVVPSDNQSRRYFAKPGEAEWGC